LTFVCALAWNHAFTNWLKQNNILNEFGPWAYAILITVLTILIAFGGTPIVQQTPKVNVNSFSYPQYGSNTSTR